MYAQAAAGLSQGESPELGLRLPSNTQWRSLDAGGQWKALINFGNGAV